MDWFDVMRRFENEDPTAFETLRALIHGKLARMRRHKHFDHAEDVTQDTLICLLRAWRNGCIRDEQCFDGFVWRLAERRLADAWNHHARPGGADCVGDPELAAEAFAELAECRHERAMDLTRALDRLDTEEQRALMAIYLEGKTYVEAAEGLGLPLGTFKRRLCECLKKMRALLM